MKASPVRPGDYIEFFAEVNLLGALSACPGGACSETISDEHGELVIQSLCIESCVTHSDSIVPPLLCNVQVASPRATRC
jgi:uncharacterized protein YcgI (DUF1989 family)